MGKHQFQFKQFLIQQEHCAMKVSTDSCLFGAWVADQITIGGKALDIGAGTGLLSLMLAQKAPEMIIDAVEIEQSCHAQMNMNVKESLWSARISSILGDVREYEPNHRYQTIISNPPFYDRQLESPNQEINLARHGHTLNLVDFFNHAERLLAPEGDLYVLMPYYRLEEVMKVASTFKLHPSVTVTVKHSQHHTPFRNMFRFRKEPTNHELISIIIYDENSKYTKEFTSLLQPYYLHL